MKPWRAQARAETRMTLERGETLLLTIGIPVLLLLFFSLTHVVGLPGTRRVNFLAPGIIALCVLSSAMVSLSIATGFDRSYGVLRRLYLTPLTRRGLIAAKIAAVLVVEVLQVTVIALVAVALSWRPAGGIGAIATATAALLVATVSFAGIGLILAGTLRAEVNLAASNGLYLVLLLVSGFVLPAARLPHVLQNVLVFTPSGALADGLHRSLGAGQWFGTANLVSLVLWAVVAPLVAAATFRFD